MQLVIEPKSMTKFMTRKGYQQVGEYKGDPRDPNKGRLVYFLSTVGNNATYNQGIMQTVQLSQNGIDPRTGRTVNGMTLGIINDPAEVAKIARGSSNASKTEKLLPVFDEKGQIVAYEYSISPEMLALRQPNLHFGQMMGALAGRQYEEQMAREANRELIKAIKAQYDKEKLQKGTQYINLAKSDDPIHKDTWKMVDRKSVV